MMKKRNLTILIALIIPFLVKAQVGEPRHDLAIGLNGGYSMNQVSFNPTIKQAFKGGLTYGFTTRYTCEKYFNMLCALQFEVNYTQMGWKELFEDNDPRGYERTMNYIQIPLLANLGFGRERGGVKGYLIVGPQIGLFLNESEKKTGDWTQETELYQSTIGKEGSTQSIRIMQHWMPTQKKFEYGITGGLGMDLSTKSGHHFLLEGRYFFGLSDIFNNTKQDPYGRSANGAIVCKFAYLFDVVKTRN